MILLLYASFFHCAIVLRAHLVLLFGKQHFPVVLFYYIILEIIVKKLDGLQ